MTQIQGRIIENILKELSLIKKTRGMLGYNSVAILEQFLGGNINEISKTILKKIMKKILRIFLYKFLTKFLGKIQLQQSPGSSSTNSSRMS